MQHTSEQEIVWCVKKFSKTLMMKLNPLRFYRLQKPQKFAYVDILCITFCHLSLFLKLILVRTCKILLVNFTIKGNITTDICINLKFSRFSNVYSEFFKYFLPLFRYSFPKENMYLNAWCFATTSYTMSYTFVRQNIIRFMWIIKYIAVVMYLTHKDSCLCSVT